MKMVHMDSKYCCCMHRNWDNVVAALGLQIKQPRNHGLILIMDTSPKCPVGCGFHLTSGNEECFPNGKVVRLVPRLSDEMPPFPHMLSCWA